MSLQTPLKIRTLQRKLYSKAKGEPTDRFYLLYDKIYREDILAHAYHQVKTNYGAPGVDGQTYEMIESGELEKWLEGIRKELRDRTYKPQPVRRVMIDKPGGGQRPLGIPTIRDRTVQTAAKLVLEPISGPVRRRKVWHGSGAKWEISRSRATWRRGRKYGISSTACYKVGRPTSATARG